MERAQVISSLAEWGNWMLEELGKGSFNHKLEEAYIHNRWFTPPNVTLAIKSIARNYLNAEKLNIWLSNYEFRQDTPENIGVIMAGNLPLVGFHDLLSVLVSGNRAIVKLSSKDTILLPFLLNQLDSYLAANVLFVDKLNSIDALIATGSNNSARYFEYYFGKYPHIIRKNRNSIAVLRGKETKEDIEKLGKDIFQYFGLGCRNVSKLYLPEGFSLNEILDSLDACKEIIDHSKYANNYQYWKNIMLLNNEEHLDTGFLLLKEEEKIASPLSMLHYEYYKSEEELNEHLSLHLDEIQCIVSSGDDGINAIPFGTSQEPGLWDYADNVDTMKFLMSL